MDPTSQASEFVDTDDEKEMSETQQDVAEQVAEQDVAEEVAEQVAEEVAEQVAEEVAEQNVAEEVAEQDVAEQAAEQDVVQEVAQEIVSENEEDTEIFYAAEQLENKLKVDVQSYLDKQSNEQNSTVHQYVAK